MLFGSRSSKSLKKKNTSKAQAHDPGRFHWTASALLGGCPVGGLHVFAWCRHTHPLRECGWPECERRIQHSTGSNVYLLRCFTDGCAATDGTPVQEHLRPLAVFFRLLELCSILFQCLSMGKDVSMICHWWKECLAQERIDLCCTGYVCIAIPSDEILMDQFWVIWDEVGSHMVQLGDNCSPGWSQHGPSTGNMNLHQAPKEVISWCKLYTSPMPQAPGLLSHSYPQVMCSLSGLPHVQEHGWLWHSLARDWTCWSPMFPFFDKYTGAANDVSKH